MKTLTAAVMLALIPAGIMLHTETIKLVDPDAGDFDEFGRAVGIAGGRLIIGSQFDDNVGSASGSASIFQRSFVDGQVMWDWQGRIIGDDSRNNDRFGFSTAISGDFALAGAPFDDLTGGRVDAGSAYVFQHYDDGNGLAWNQRRKLTASDGQVDDGFGWTVAMLGDIAVVGAPRADQMGVDAGAVYIFERENNNWPELTTLFADNPVDQALFGSSVALDGDRLVVGAFLDVRQAEIRGAAYVFERFEDDDGVVWSLEQRLTASDGNAFDEFGYAVDISGNIIVVGAPDDDDASDIAGAAYIFEYDMGRGASPWVETSKLIASDAGVEDEFGSSVGVSNGVVLIGKHWDDGLGVDAGSAYVFTRNSNNALQELSRINASDGAAGDEFAFALALDSSNAVVGARFHDSEGTDAGAAYYFAPAQLLGDLIFGDKFGD